MSIVQNLLKAVLPRTMFESMEAESKQWKVRCECGYQTTIWDAGGIRWKAAGQPRRFMQCPNCGTKRWMTVTRE